MKRAQGTTLLELIIALALGLIILSGAISAYFFASEYALRQQDEVYVHERFSEIEMQVRATIPLAIFRPHCGGVISPRFKEAVLGTGINQDLVDRLIFPIMVHTDGNSPNNLSSKSSKTTTSNQFKPAISKSIAGLIAGSDLLSITHLEQLSFKNAWSNYDVRFHDSFGGKSELTLLITDCRQSAIVRASKDSKGDYVVNTGDYNSLQQLFTNKNKLLVYSVISQIFYLKKENDQINFIQDFLDGSNFFRVPNLLLLRIWIYDEKSRKWQRANSSTNWYKVSALAAQMVVQSPNPAKKKEIILTPPSLFGHTFGENLSIDSPRLANLNAVFMFKLYNY